MCVNQTRFSVPGTTKSMGCRWVNSWRGRFLGIGHSNPDQNYNLYNLSSWSQRMGKRAEQNRHYLCKYFMFLGKGWDVVSIAWAWILWCVDLVWFDVHLDIYVAHSECPTPVPLWVVIVSIVGGILAVGLALLIALKIIIMILQRIEYNDFVKNKVVWGEVWIGLGFWRKKWVGQKQKNFY